MTDFLQKLWDAAAANLDGYVILIVLCSGYFQNLYLKNVVINKKDPAYNSALKTLILSFIISFIYILLVRNPDNPTNWSKYFISYFTATSLYELIIEKFINWMAKKNVT